MMNRMIQTWKVALFLFACAAALFAQDLPAKKAPSVTMSPIDPVSITRGKTATVTFQFHVNSGFHINSNKPTEEYLIPTLLRLDVPTDLMVGKTTYPDGETMSFAFAPDEKLSVYSGDFNVSVIVRALTSVLPGKYEFHGELKYQACDNAQCYPPKKLPVQFEVKVLKAPPPHVANPAQSPHAHT